MDKPLSSHRILALIGGSELLGKERGNLEALSALKRQGATVMVGISSRVPNGGQVGDEARRRGFETREFPMGSHFSKRWMLLDGTYRNKQLKRLWSNSKELTAAIRDWNPSHVHIAAHDTFIFFALALLFNRVPLIFRCGDAPPISSRFQMFIWNWMVRRSDSIISVSHFIKQRMINVVPSATKKTTVIHNIAPSRKGTPDHELIQKLITEKRPFQLVYVGQIHAIKGVPLLVDALLALDDPDIGCWMVGGNPHTQKEEKKLKEKVANSPSRTDIRWEGFKSDPRPHFAAADWHIAPSVCQEAFGNVVREAQSMGTPSIISGNGGLPETLTHGKTGLVVPDVSAGSLAAMISRAKSLNGAYFSEAAKQLGENVNRQIPFDQAWTEALT